MKEKDNKDKVISKDQQQEQEQERTRYSDEELNEFKELIEGKLETARAELEYLQKQIKRATEDPDNHYRGLEDGSGTSEKEYLNKMAGRQIQYITHLENALFRIQNKVYGICRETNKLISKERLKIVPHATLSVEAKNNRNAPKNQIRRFNVKGSR